MERRLSKDWREVRLSKNFTAGEFVVSATRPDLAAAITPTIEQFNNFHLLANMVLQRVRDQFGTVRITSGLVTPELNAARTTAPLSMSQHLYGEAVDFVVTEAYPATVFLWIQNVLRFSGELLYYQQRGHLHLALPSPWAQPDQKIIVGA